MNLRDLLAIEHQPTTQMQMCRVAPLKLRILICWPSLQEETWLPSRLSTIVNVCIHCQAGCSQRQWWWFLPTQHIAFAEVIAFLEDMKSDEDTWGCPSFCSRSQNNLCNRWYWSPLHFYWDRLVHLAPCSQEADTHLLLHVADAVHKVTIHSYCCGFIQQDSCWWAVSCLWSWVKVLLIHIMVAAMVPMQCLTLTLLLAETLYLLLVTWKSFPEVTESDASYPCQGRSAEVSKESMSLLELGTATHELLLECKFAVVNRIIVLY